MDINRSGSHHQARDRQSGSLAQSALTHSSKRPTGTSTAASVSSNRCAHRMAYTSTRQALIVTFGLGWVQLGVPIEEIRPGDVICLRRGAWQEQLTTAMTHIHSGSANGKPVD